MHTMSFSNSDPYPYSNSPTRSLQVTCAYSFSEALRAQLEAFGDVRALHTDMLPYGMLTVHYYDIRNAETAFRTIRNYYSQRYHSTPTLLPWAFYLFPPSHLQNQGTIVVFNLDSQVSNRTLHQSFRAFGPIKEFRASSTNKNLRFVEFFDVRDAARALEQMDGKEVGGNAVVIQYSRPGGLAAGNNLFDAATGCSYQQQHQALNNDYFPTPLTLPSPPSSHPTAMRSSENLNQANEDKDYSQYEIMEENGGNVDSRTTVMIKNIPNRCSLNQLLEMLDEHCINCNDQIGEGDDQPLSSYDFLFLPIDYSNKCNIGYGFVNMTSPQAALRLYKAFHGKHWESFGSRKICQITYAKFQGTEALAKKKKSKFIEKIEHMPVVFRPARDGRQVTEPESLWMLPNSNKGVPSDSDAAPSNDDVVDDKGTAVGELPNSDEGVPSDSDAAPSNDDVLDDKGIAVGELPNSDQRVPSDSDDATSNDDVVDAKGTPAQ